MEKIELKNVSQMDQATFKYALKNLMVAGGYIDYSSFGALVQDLDGVNRLLITKHGEDCQILDATWLSALLNSELYLSQTNNNIANIKHYQNQLKKLKNCDREKMFNVTKVSGVFNFEYLTKDQLIEHLDNYKFCA